MADRAPRRPVAVGEEAVVDIGPMAHGGHAVAHHAGHTVFVRHAIPGERVRIRITEVRSKFVRADAIDVLSASEDRVVAPCPWAAPGGCGGCDFQHIDLSAQREVKSTIVSSALRRAGVWDASVPVEALPGADDGLHWRTRVRWTVDADGRAGLVRARSHEVVHVEQCLLASPGISAADIPHAGPFESDSVWTAEDCDGAVAVSGPTGRLRGPTNLVQRVRHRQWRIPAEAFWQVHPGAAQALVDCMLEFGLPTPGERWWDLYSGAGLFGAFIGEAVGESGTVDCVESSAEAIRGARRSLHDLRQVRLHEERVDTWVASQTDRIDGVVLDPPRAGAGPDAVAGIVAAQPRVVVYVACDPVALARDLASFRSAGYGVRAVQAFDTFPMTHHVETVAALMPDNG